MKKKIYFTHHAKKTNDLINFISENLLHNGVCIDKGKTAATCTDNKPKNI